LVGGFGGWFREEGEEAVGGGDDGGEFMGIAAEDLVADAGGALSDGGDGGALPGALGRPVREANRVGGGGGDGFEVSIEIRGETEGVAARIESGLELEEVEVAPGGDGGTRRRGDGGTRRCGVAGRFGLAGGAGVSDGAGIKIKIRIVIKIEFGSAMGGGDHRCIARGEEGGGFAAGAGEANDAAEPKHVDIVSDAGARAAEEFGESAECDGVEMGRRDGGGRGVLVHEGE
jgi:hypothetical protein